MLNHTVDVDGNDRAGIRWYELRDSGSGIHQESTYSGTVSPPDDNHRWMGSIAMNGTGDVALGYSVTGPGVDPSIGVTGRLSDDPLNQMEQGEVLIQAGSGYQTHSSGRWGDYSSMTVDPTDDCTFWYTQEYYANGAASANWQTRIGSFELRECGAAGSPPAASIVSPAAGAEVSGTVTIQISATDIEDTTAGSLTVEWNVDGGTWQSATYNSSTSYYEASWNTAGVGDGNHTINAQATGSDSQTGSTSSGVTVNNVNDPPTASFTFSCNGLTCDFDALASSDPDGTIAGYAWDFGDGNNGSGVTTSHTYATAGTRTVTLTVTDDGGDSGNQGQSVTVSEPSPISLTASGYKVKGLQKADLLWSGATSATVDVYRDGVLIVTTANDGSHTDNIDQRGSGTYTYWVCEAGTSTCSNDATAAF